jgi:hypothetical protein
LSRNWVVGGSVLVVAVVLAGYLLGGYLFSLSDESIRLNAIVYHVVENETVGNVTMHVPDVSAVYQQILTANNDMYENVLLFPTYAGSWEDEFTWLADNFGGPNGIPIMFEVLCGGDSVLFQLTVDQILATMEVCNVKYLRFAEVISFCLENDLVFPAEYVSAILGFCRDNGLRLFWTEWKVDYPPEVETFRAIQSFISGFEDVVTVSFSTNSEEMEPVEGFAYLKSMFLHWGGSVQSWYWETRQRLDRGGGPIVKEESRDMPFELIIEHALACRDAGGEVIQFEPYWYFFGDRDGEAREILEFLHSNLNSGIKESP